jgi:hypothetical protein
MSDPTGWAREQRDEWLHARDHDEHRTQPTPSAEQRRPWEGADPDEAQP